MNTRVEGWGKGISVAMCHQSRSCHAISILCLLAYSISKFDDLDFYTQIQVVNNNFEHLPCVSGSITAIHDLSHSVFTGTQ